MGLNNQTNFVWYRREFVITVIVITKFDCRYFGLQILCAFQGPHVPALRHHSRKHEETKNYIFWLYKFISDFFKFLTDHNHLQIRLVRHKSKTSESMIPIDSANLRKQEQQQHWDQLVAYLLTHTAPIFSCQLFFPSLVKNSAEQRKWLTRGLYFGCTFDYTFENNVKRSY